MFWCSHIKHEDITDAFADAVCDVIGKGVIHLMKNGSINTPLPPAAKKQKVTVAMGISDE